MDIVKLLEDYNIPTAPSSHKHSRPGWINVACPFHVTEHPGYHLGFTLDGNLAYCWSCGIHFIDQSLSKILNVSVSSAKSLITEYVGSSTHHTKGEANVRIGIQSYQMPGNMFDEMPKSYRKYLEQKRNFDPDYLIKTWGLRSTGPVSLLKEGKKQVDYGKRILAPIFWNGKEVTFQARDITDTHPMKYLACPKSREIIHHKHLIYLHPKFKGNTILMSEGITDVWRFGKYSGATFGIEYKIQQVRVIASLFKRVAVVFDDEPQAVRKANDLVADLRFRKVDAFRVDIVGDPGGLPQEEANYIVKQIIH